AGRMEKNERKLYQFWLHNLPGVGEKTIQRLLVRFGSEEAIYRAGIGAFREVLGEKRTQAIAEFQKSFSLRKRYEEMLSKNISFYTAIDREYPSRLRELAQPPYGIYCLGKLPKQECPAAAVIGARECSEYGSSMAKAFAGKLAEAGVSIISGMARGIDGIGQQAALASGGKTYAVLGCGVDVCYPLSNKRLYREILEKGGGILSVFPPGRQPLKQQFPERNRIVAGLSDLILVAEARQKSGTWITVDMALEQGKNVYAIPGRLTDRLSDGCNLLIRQGAGIALSPEDLLAELLLLQNRKMQEKRSDGAEKEDLRREEVLHGDVGEKKARQGEETLHGVAGERGFGQGREPLCDGVGERGFQQEREPLRGVVGKREFQRRRETLHVGVEEEEFLQNGKEDIGMEVLQKAGVSAETRNQTEKEILRFLDYHAKSVDEILGSMRRAGVSIELSQLLDELICLCMEGKAKQVGGNYFVKRSNK
ncbi:MAG: DNA-processing protein DprA, partial [Clostridium sp.]|nr:DNA-processing protein DprA [Clostridium sp.]